MCTRFLISLLLVLLLVPLAQAAEDYQLARVEDPFIELHTGPGRGYPVFYIAERGEWVEILKRKTDWFKVRTRRGKEGWVHVDQMRRTLDPLGRHWSFRRATFEDYRKRDWEFGMLVGDFSGAHSLTVYGSYFLSPNLSAELDFADVLGTFSDSLMLNVKLVSQPFPEWRISPFFTIGTGYIYTSPHTTLVQAQDRSDLLSHVGIGARMYIMRRFLIRAEYDRYTIFTSRNDNEEIDEWKLGFGFFF